jgi:DNA invertase Pin-like site-specific DNA recombinase
MTFGLLMPKEWRYMDNQNIKAVAFVRVASTTQSKQEKSNGQQMRQISEYAQQHNIKIVKWFVQSGKQFDYAEVLNFCKRNPEVEQLLVTDIARLGRSLEQLLVLKHSLKGIGVTIRTCDGAVHETPMGVFMDNIRALLSQTDFNIRSDLTKQRMLERVAEGYSVTRPPFGYERTLTNGLYQPTRFGETLGTILQAIAEESLPLSRAIADE